MSVPTKALSLPLPLPPGDGGCGSVSSLCPQCLPSLASSHTHSILGKLQNLSASLSSSVKWCWCESHTRNWERRGDLMPVTAPSSLPSVSLEVFFSLLLSLPT